jgi:hypothetical protein
MLSTIRSIAWVVACLALPLGLSGCVSDGASPNGASSAVASAASSSGSSSPASIARPPAPGWSRYESQTARYHVDFPAPYQVQPPMPGVEGVAAVDPSTGIIFIASATTKSTVGWSDDEPYETKARKWAAEDGKVLEFVKGNMNGVTCFISVVDTVNGRTMELTTVRGKIKYGMHAVARPEKPDGVNGPTVKAFMRSFVLLL